MELDLMAISQNTVKIILLLGLPSLIVSMVIGLIISIFQAVTQINEQTMSFIPKILVIIGALVIFAPWMSDTLTTFTRDLYISIPSVVLGK